MSLQVWLPLDGDLHNQGLENITTTIQTAVINDNGKIGKCYSFNGSNQQLRMTFPSAVTSAIGSLSCWIKFNAFPASGGFMSVIKICDLGGYSKTLFGITMQGTNQIAVCIKGTVTNNTYTHSLSTGIWYHLCVVYDGTKIKIYLNGSVVLDKTAQTSSLTSVSSLHIGGSDNYYLNGFMNDVRYYDHALSPKEVEEIAKGLVLWYQLADGYVEGTTNLLSAADSFPEPSNAGFSSSNTYQGRYFYTSSNSLTTYTGSAYINNTSNLSICVNVGGLQTQSGGIWVNIAQSQWLLPGEKGWLSATAPITSAYRTTGIRVGVMCSSSQSNLTSLPTVQFLQLEEKDHQTPWTLGGTTRTSTTVYDSSGYSHNGTIVGSLTAAAGSPRYEIATHFPGSAAIKFLDFNLGNIWSAGIWFKSPSTATQNWSSLFAVNNNGGDADLKMNIYYQQTAGTSQFSANGQYTTITGISKDQWHHIMEVFDGSTLYCYLDGILKTTKAITNAEFSRKNLVVGARSTATDGSTIANYFNGQLSDFRIYATALTAAQVKELYNTSMLVDASGNVSPRELGDLI